MEVWGCAFGFVIGFVWVVVWVWTCSRFLFVGVLCLYLMFKFALGLFVWVCGCVGGCVYVCDCVCVGCCAGLGVFASEYPNFEH